MKHRVSFIVTGTFIIVGAFILTFVLFFDQKKDLLEDNFDKYYTYTTESVSGLRLNSRIRYKGISIGKVSGYKIQKNNINNIQITLSIQKDFPITDGMFAELVSQGLSGGKFVSIGSSAEDEFPIDRLNDKYPVIQNKISFMASMTPRIEEIGQNTNIALNKINSILSTQTIKNSEKVIENINKLSPALNKALQDVSHVTKSINDIAININMLTHNINKRINNDEFNIKPELSRAVNEAIMLIKDIRKTNMELQEFITQLKDSPSDIIYKSKTNKRGPGE